MRNSKRKAEKILEEKSFPYWSGRAVWSVGDGSGGGEVGLYGGTPRNVWLTRRSHSSMCVRGVYRVLTLTH